MRGDEARAVVERGASVEMCSFAKRGCERELPPLRALPLGGGYPASATHEVLDAKQFMEGGSTT